jgi:Helix-turn-helix domain
MSFAWPAFSRLLIDGEKYLKTLCIRALVIDLDFSYFDSYHWVTEIEMIDLATCSAYTLLSTAEVAELLNISEASVRKLARDGRLRVIGGFRVLYFSARAVREFVNGCGALPGGRLERVADEDRLGSPEPQADLG